MKQPLADALRPNEPQEFLGQSQLQKKIAPFYSEISNLLLFGPPGCGKSTLALLLAKASGKKYRRISAPEAGLPKLRGAIAGAEILILDEIHRFSKAQQDFFLPLLESGELILIATTTENPSFCVTRQLLSRMHVLRLVPLDKSDLEELGRRGAAYLGVELDESVVRILATQARGDARAMLNLVEYAAALPADQRQPENMLAALPEVLSRHDKNGDNHFELASALIKSIRGSDADAAIYYLACLLEGGEDPRFVCRRLILAAAEDIGLADPHALPLAVACQQAVEFTGMPEGFIPLAETVLYLALAKKSNSAYAAYLRAARHIKENGPQPPPLHILNGVTSLQKAWGYGKDYKYPHNYPESWIEQAYLPDSLEKSKFFIPRDNGLEPSLTSWWRKRQKDMKP